MGAGLGPRDSCSRPHKRPPLAVDSPALVTAGTVLYYHRLQQIIDKAKVLIEALPYISAFRGRTMVVKVGGRALEDDALRQRFAEDLVLLSWVGINVANGLH